MGNRENSSNQDGFQRMLSEINKQQHRRVNVHPEKYLQLMVEQVEKAKLPSKLKQALADTLRQKLSEVELIECISCINALKNNEFQTTTNKNFAILREKPQSKNVKVVFGEGFVSKILKNLPINVTQNNQKSQEQSVECPSPNPRKRESNSNNRHKLSDIQIKQRLKNISSVMRKQLNRISHPFGKLNKAFAQFIQQHSEQYLPKSKKEQVYEKALRLLILDWCGYLEVSCLSPYRKWIISYTGIQEAKYSKWLRSIVIQQIWAVNNGYLFSMLATVIQGRKINLLIDTNQLQYSAAQLTPSLFHIDPKLQIQGHFFDSIYEMSEVVSRVRPQQILGQLQTVKKRICTDIDNYHRLVQKGQVYEIDSDNILSIVSYILCKIGSRIDQIHTHLIFLRIVYGQNVYYSMGLGSYMLSTIFGAFQFLQSSNFKDLLIKRNPNSCIDEEKSGVNQSQTKGTLSLKQEISSKGQPQISEIIHIGSLILPQKQMA